MRGDRDRASRLPRLAGHVLRRQHERRGPDLSANLRRYVCEGGLREAVYDENAAGRGRFAERPGPPVLRIAGRAAAAGADRSRNRVLRYGGAARVQLILAVNDIDHTRTKAQSPQTYGICERFHKTILNEFYQVVFRKKLYTTMEELHFVLHLL